MMKAMIYGIGKSSEIDKMTIIKKKEIGYI